MSAFAKTIVRSIRGSLGRFLAIMGIVALGCGFFAGLQMCGPDMRSAADELYDGTSLYDIRVVSTLGFGDEDVSRIHDVEGIDSVMPSVTVDVMARMGSEQVAARVSSLDVHAAQESTEDGVSTIVSTDGNYLNRIFLREGCWPRAPDECVLVADKAVGGVGVGDKVEVLYGSTDVDDVLRERTFNVVGMVSSSNYPYTGSFGSTTLGSGMIAAYLFVPRAALVDDVAYTEIYATASGADALESGSDAYEDAVGLVSERLEDQGDKLAEARLKDVRGEAQDELDEKRGDFEKERDDARKELADAKSELDDARKELDDAKEELAKGQRDYDDGARKLDDSRRDAYDQLDAGQTTIDDSRSELESRQGELDDARAQLEEGMRAYGEGVSELLAQTGASSLEEARVMLEGGVRQADEGIQQLSSTLDGAGQLADQRIQLEIAETELLWGLSTAGIVADSVQEAKGMLEASVAQLEGMGAPEEQIAPLRESLAAASELVGAREQFEAGRSQLLAGLAAQGIEAADEKQAAELLGATLEETKAKRAQAQEGLDAIAQLEASAAELESGRLQLEDGERQIAEGWEKLESGQSELDGQRTDAEGKLDDAQRELDDARGKLESGKSDLASGTKEYESGKADYKKAKKEADTELADAEKKLDDAQAEIDDIEEPEIYVLDRSQNEGALTYDADSHRIDHIADVFPFMFFLVAALVALTTMTRMVEDDRIELGTYKALGYGTARIASKYLVYAGLAGTIGATVGILVLSQVLPFIVTSSYAIIYVVPLHPFPLPIDPLIALASGGLGVGVTLLATWVAVVSSLRETPATLMLPRAPVAGKRILLERVGPVWRRLSFSWKVTCRNMFRYKRRLAMTVIGISGCTALLLVGFGLHDAIWDIIDCQYGPIIHYDTTVALDEDANSKDVKEVVSALESTGEVTDIIRVQGENMQAGVRDGGEKIRVQVVVPQDESQIEKAVTFVNRISREPIAFDEGSVIITEKLSLKYGLEVGDEILLYDQDAIGNVVGDGHPCAVTGVAENYVGNYVYLGKKAWREIDAEKPVFSTIYASTTADDEVRAGIAQDLRDRDDVSTVVFSDETINLYRNMLSVVDLVVVVLIVSAGALAFIVLYNLTNINIGERVREIASLKVLGFTRQEVYAYIFREILLLAIIGDVFGLAFGTWLETFVVVTAEVDYVMFGRTIHPVSFTYAFILTIVFCGLIMFVMRRKLDRVDMVESLKSVD